jgi:eukaryotic-like serine/threonine-protein kinase
MTLTNGTKLGPYEIVSPLGAGGMGEVYRSRDPRLKREVAIKVLPQAFSLDADRLRRFEQEARTCSGDMYPAVRMTTPASVPWVAVVNDVWVPGSS